MDDVSAKNFLNSIVVKIRESRLFTKVEQEAHFRGYFTELVSGELRHDSQIDLFILYEVKDSKGETIDTFDDGPLCSYEPMVIKRGHGSWQIAQDGYKGFLNDLRVIERLLRRSGFVVRAIDNKTDSRIQTTEGITIRQKWSRHGVDMAIIEMKSDMFGRLLSIGDLIAIENQVYQIIQIA